jgi:hypothetical protein
MLLDVLKLGCLAERLGIIPVQMPQPVVNGRVTTTNITDVALEVLHIHGIETDNGREETDICFCDMRGGEKVWR